MEHVDYVVPIISTYAILKYGNYEMYANIRGIESKDFDRLGIVIGDGHFPTDDNTLELFFGNTTVLDFYNPKSGEMLYTGDGKSLDLANMQMFLIFDTDNYSNTGSGEGADSNSKKAKKYIPVYAGIMTGGPEDYSNNSFYVYMNIETLKKILRKEFKNRTIPNQPVNKNGKPYKELFYSTVLVYADDMSNVTDIQKEIGSLGFDAYSNTEWIESQMKSLENIQTLLGCIGAVSLIVAAIGIINTMMMSIYERTKEIGVMKVIGCRLKDIQFMFLTEAAFIGFIGGVVGVGLSFAIRPVVNNLFGSNEMLMMGGESANLVVLPPWLILLALIFSTIIGMIAGLLPSIRAVKLSPLEALRT